MAVESQTSSGAEGAKEQVQEKAQQAASTVQSRMREQVDQRSTQAGEQLSSHSEALRSTSQKLREEGKEGPAKAAEQLAERTERLGGYMKEADADRILGDIEDFGRRQPLAVAAIGLAAGFAASRFLKASSQQRFESRGGSDYAGRYGGTPSYPRAGGAGMPSQLGGGAGGVSSDVEAPGDIAASRVTPPPAAPTTPVGDPRTGL